MEKGRAFNKEGDCANIIKNRRQREVNLKADTARILSIRKPERRSETDESSIAKRASAVQYRAPVPRPRYLDIIR